MTHSLYTPTSVFALLRFITKYLARRGSSKPSQPPADDSDHEEDLVRLRRQHEIYISVSSDMSNKKHGVPNAEVRRGSVTSRHNVT